VEVSGRLAQALTTLAGDVDGIIVMEQTDRPGTGVIAGPVIAALRAIASGRPTLPMLADSRRGFGDYPPLSFKMNAAELANLEHISGAPDLNVVRTATARLAGLNRRPAFVTLAERGVVVATAEGAVDHLPALPLRGPIDVVGAGDSVSANLLAALAAGATPSEAGAVAMAASSHVIHQLATTGTANVAQIRALLSGTG
jgi:sugar/nucleoside kinase (ribokinase family)